MSKSKKNTIDPEVMIKNMGQILSDGLFYQIAHGKDIQWSDAGVVSSHKFLQKIWNLNTIIINRLEKNVNDKLVEKFQSEIDNLINKIDNSIGDFRFNVSIAHFYEAYNLFNKNINSELSNKCLQNNIIKIMKLLLPFTPHLASECLEFLNCKTVNKWPEIKKNLKEEIKFAIQVNGKTRDIISVQKNTSENQINKVVLDNSKAKKYLENKRIIKTIFVKDKIINYIIK